ncbi:polysaccharide deacetylase [Mucilaginibacter sp. RS28]|uniref:Polysaccharide deacetylase n=1 Tax=Mucilaginibacter straminoryzae TaxID=2932774 RepID=A0A9X1X6K7_9SPHI|nr:polysaccharide deacetylase [Mucilaginibacter straminoryzae]MCJ8211295.1 polysaccharide deacetylase [Mucilaginibacter straminoryzae]
MKLKFTFILLLLLSSAAFGQYKYQHIQNYRTFYGWARHFPQDWIMLRQFDNLGKHYALLVNPQTLETKIDETNFYQVKPLSLDEVRAQFKRTPYEKALRQAENTSRVIQDAGIEHGLPEETGVTLTADLCPSHRPLDRVIFTDLTNEFSKVEKPVPIGLSVSGLWMLRHEQDLNWLKSLEQQHQINITWINHSFNHRVSLTKPLKENFLLEPGTDINYEVLETEKLMLKNGLIPSVFFRFPGLVSDQQLVFTITKFGLIPIGTDAWLAKGQQPHSGSIVLIHGNGNEPVGVKDFINLLKSKTSAITKKQWLLYDLRESVDEEFDAEK